MKKMIDFSVEHPVPVLMAVFAVMLCGFISALSLKVDFLPKITERHILVTTEFEGISAEELEKLVTVPVESSVAAVKGIKTLSSVTRDSLSLVTIELHWNTNGAVALAECRELLDACYGGLPSGCKKPSACLFSPEASECLTIAVLPKRGDLQYCRYICEKAVRLELQRLEGVASVTVSGGLQEEYNVVVDKERLESFGLSLQAVAEILASTNFEYPAGTLTEGMREFLFRTKGLFDTDEALLSSPVSFDNGGLVRLSDFASLEKSSAQRNSFFLYNGAEGVCLNVFKKSEASPLSLSKRVKVLVSELNELYGSHFEFVVINDRAVQLRRSIAQLLFSALAGILVSVSVLFVFLRSVRGAVLVASMIPLSALCSLSALAILGRTINTLSLSGIAVGIGMVIDPATVVLESISKKSDDRSAVSAGVREVSLSTAGSALTTAVVFVPLFFTGGLSGILFKDMSVAVISAILSSALLSLTYIPAVYMLLFAGKISLSGRGLQIHRCEKIYRRSLLLFFRKGCLKYVLLGSCIILGCLFAFMIKKELLPESSGDALSVVIDYPENTALDFIAQDSSGLCRELNNTWSFEDVLVFGGMEPDSFVQLSSPSQRKESIRLVVRHRSVKKALNAVSSLLEGAGYKYRIQNASGMLESLLSVDDDAFVVTADDEASVLDRALALAPDKADVIPYSLVSETVFVPDRQSCAKYSVSTSEVALAARNSASGVYSSPVYRGGREIPLLVSYKKMLMASPQSLLDVRIFPQLLPLSVLVKMDERQTEKLLYRFNRLPAKRLSSLKDDVSTDGIISRKRQQVGELLSDAVLLLCIVVLLLYFVIGIQFESFVLPLLLLVAIPPAFSGAFLFLIVFRQSMNINSVIALVVLFGVSVNNSILLYEAMLQELPGKDASARKLVLAAVSACASRLRVILMTSVTTIFALLPFSVDPSHHNSQSSMCLAVIGGLLVSLVIVLLAVPPVLALLLKGRRKHNE